MKRTSYKITCPTYTDALTRNSKYAIRRKRKIFKYTMLIARTKEQDITTTMDTYMDVIGSYKQQIKEANDRIAYLEGKLHL